MPIPTFPFRLPASINYSVTGDYTNVGSGVMIDNVMPFTFWGWYYFDTLLNFSVLQEKAVFAGASFRSTLVMADGACRGTIARDSAQAQARSVAGTVSAGVWTFFAYTYDETDGPRLFTGTFARSVTEVSYAATYPQVGSGATTSDASGVMYLGSNVDVDGPILTGRAQVQGLIARRLTIGELNRVAAYPMSTAMRSDTRGLWIHGIKAKGLVPDFSPYGNHGTVVVSRLTPAMPHRVRRSRRRAVATTAAVATYSFPVVRGRSRGIFTRTTPVRGAVA